MFKENLKGILQNLPLILSDTQDVQNVSLNRVIIFFSFICTVIFVAVLFLFLPNLIQPCLSYFQAWLAFLGTLISGNMAKNVLNNRNQNNQ